MEILFFWIMMGVIVGMIAASKKRSFVAWALYGLLIWPVALVHILISKTTIDPDTVRKCPYCAEIINREAIVCKHCGRDLVPVAPEETQAQISQQT